MPEGTLQSHAGQTRDVAWVLRAWLRFDPRLAVQSCSWRGAGGGGSVSVVVIASAGGTVGSKEARMKVLLALLLAANGVAWVVAQGTIVPGTDTTPDFASVRGAPLRSQSRFRRGRGVD